MITITVKVKFKLTGKNKTKTIKLGLEFPRENFPCFPDIVDEVFYKAHDPKLIELLNEGFIIGVEQILDY